MVERLSAESLRKQTEDDLLSQRDALRDELYHLRYKMHVEEVENPNAKKELKRNIARINTVLRERELQSATADTAAGAEPEQE